MSKRVLKLFVIKNDSGATVKGDDGEPLYFDNKMIAKENKPDSFHTIGYGPDHRHFNRGENR